VAAEAAGEEAVEAARIFDLLIVVDVGI